MFDTMSNTRQQKHSSSNKNGKSEHRNLSPIRKENLMPIMRTNTNLGAANGDQRPLTKSYSNSLMYSRELKTAATTTNNGGDVPEAKSPYNGLTHGVRRIMPHDLACKVGCSGAKCKYDNSNWPSDEMAIDGVFSHWITDDILAMARPRDILIKKGNLIHKMKKAGIRSIFNLQSRNEHKDCGQGILKESGFSYDPNDFIKEEVYYYNFELEDYNIASIHKMLDMVKVLAFALTEGKAAVHCHAGLGRTGLFIACYLIYAHRLNSNEAINFIRERRPKSVQMNDQIQAVREFENYLAPLRVVYSNVNTSNTLPKITSSKDDQPNGASNNNNNNNNSNANTLGTMGSFNLHMFLIRQRLFLHGKERNRLKYIPKILYVCGEQLKKLTNTWQTHGIDPVVIKKLAKFSNESSTKDKYPYDYDYDSNSRKRHGENSMSANEAIAKALAITNIPRKVMEKIEEYQKLINENNEGIDDLVNEQDPFILSGLIWLWIDQLKEPILRDQELNILLKEYLTTNFTSNFEFEMDKIHWEALDQGTMNTINYLLGLITHLLPLEESLEDKLITHLISCLTHATLKYEQSDQQQDTNELTAESRDYSLSGALSMFSSQLSFVETNNTKRSKRKQYLLLHKILKLLVRKPFDSPRDKKRSYQNGHNHNHNQSHSHSHSRTSAMRKSISQYDYEELVDDEIITTPRHSSKSSHRNDRFDHDDDDHYTARRDRDRSRQKHH